MGRFSAMNWSAFMSVSFSGLVKRISKSEGISTDPFISNEPSAAVVSTRLCDSVLISSILLPALSPGILPVMEKPGAVCATTAAEERRDRSVMKCLICKILLSKIVFKVNVYIDRTICGADETACGIDEYEARDGAYGIGS